jgi:hypothetical protein
VDFGLHAVSDGGARIACQCRRFGAIENRANVFLLFSERGVWLRWRADRGGHAESPAGVEAPQAPSPKPQAPSPKPQAPSPKPQARGAQSAGVQWVS